MSKEYGFSPEEEYAQKELIELALKSLPEREAKVLHLRFFEGMTLEETAKEMGLSSKERARQIELLGLRRLKMGSSLSPETHRHLEQLL